MTALYYILGVVAKMNAAMWRFRINFVPINVLLIAGLGLWGFAELNSAIEGTHNERTPINVSIAQIHDDASIAQSYVAVTGYNIPVALYEYGDKSSSGEITRVERSWSPLVDTANHRVLLVQHSGKTPGGHAEEATVTGMLRELAGDIRTKLATHHDSIQGVPVETRYMLVAGEEPADSMTSAITAAAVLAVVALFIIATFKRNTIFQHAELGSPVSKVKSAEPLKVGATGTFSLEQQGGVLEKRFVGMPAVLGRLDNGNPALFSNIDASSRFMGVTTSKAAGIWILAIQAGSVKKPQVGFLYWGSTRRPALRFSYSSAPGVTRQALISADDMQMLDTAVALLTTKASQQGAPVQ
ncbi:MAG TPA: hypothetical protein VFD67_04210 [Gemmatimonadaceae bacterium]|nr:hypothetical protein [Gemmatimonadaceae bacterium]